MAKKVQGEQKKTSRRGAESAGTQARRAKVLRDFYFEHNSVKFDFRAGDVWELVDEYPGDPREKKVARQVLVEFQDEGIFKAV